MSLNTEMKQKPEHIQEISENQESDRIYLLLVFHLKTMLQAENLRLGFWREEDTV